MQDPLFDDATLLQLPEELSAAWEASGVDPRRVTLAAHGTLAPPDWGEPPVGSVALDEATEESPFEPDEAPAVSSGGGHLVLGEILGRGGAGVVRLAQQPSLARDVAVKQLSAVADSPGARRRLLREARATGALEHPNIIPVHDLSHDATGQPMIVMKRVEGTAWTQQLKRPDRLDDEWLAEQIDILVEVAHAVHFAHERRVLHRDIKPDNVMLGGYGEVYVVDWGIAAALPGCTIPGLPRVEDIQDVFGTPSYMAPEMVTADAGEIGVGSDVYLLGAVLWRIICGAPPHRAPDVPQMLLKAYQNRPPPFPDDVPEPLRAICQRAMATRPSDRYPTALDLAEALEGFLKHRHAIALTREGRARLDELNTLIGHAYDDEVRAAAAARYRECRFAFEQARRIWPQSEDARRALTEAAEAMITLELDGGRPDAARALLGDLDAPHPELSDRVERALQGKREHAERLEALAADHDLAATDRARSLAAILLGLGSVTVNLVCGWLNRLDPEPLGHLVYAGAYGINVLYGGAIVVGMRKGVWSNRRNRNISLTSLLTLLGHVVVLVTCWAIGVPLAPAMVLMAVVMALIWVGGLLALDKRMWPLPVTCAVEAVLVAKLPAWAFEVRAGSVTVSLMLVAVVWSLSAPDRGVDLADL